MSATSTPTATSNDDSRPSSNRYCFVCLKELKGSEQEPAAPKPEQKEQHNLTQCCTTCKHPGTGAARLALERAGYEQIRTRTRIDSDTNSNTNSNTINRTSRNELFLAKYKYATALSECSNRSEDHTEALQLANQLMDSAFLWYGASHDLTLRAYTLFATCKLQSGDKNNSKRKSNSNSNNSNADCVLRIYEKVLETWNRKRRTNANNGAANERAAERTTAETGAFRTMLLLADLHRNENRFSDALPLVQEALALAATWTACSLTASSSSSFFSNLDMSMSMSMNMNMNTDATSTNTILTLKAQHCLGMIYYELATKAATDNKTDNRSNDDNQWTAKHTQWRLVKSHLEKAATGLPTLYGENQPTSIESV